MIPADSKAQKFVWIRWCAAAVLDDTFDLTMTEEVAYRRILDLIVKTDDRLRDDDAIMPAATKTLRQWKAVKQSLIAKGKILVGDGFIRNAGATAACIETRDFIAQRKAAAEASHKPGKRLKSNKTPPAVAATDAEAAAHPGAPANKQLQEEEGKPSSSRGADAPEQRDLFRDGLDELAALMGDAPEACRGKMAALRKAAKNDDDLVFKALAAARKRIEAGEALVDPFAWMMRGIAKRLKADKPPETAPPQFDHPEVVQGVNIERLEWAICDANEDAGGQSMSFNGTWPGFNAMLADLIENHHVNPPDHVFPVIRAAARRGFVPDHLGYWRQEFLGAVRRDVRVQAA